ncbi:rabphilin-3A-like [Felis catus]|uniref:rabphilin-3A-like n=1 Tax=Felis catus TaxID=9685 RepID=UPI001D19B4B4|nr:rabphilin-3A-like [Felis catus]
MPSFNILSVIWSCFRRSASCYCFFFSPEKSCIVSVWSTVWVRVAETRPGGCTERLRQQPCNRGTPRGRHRAPQRLLGFEGSRLCLRGSLSESYGLGPSVRAGLRRRAVGAAIFPTGSPRHPGSGSPAAPGDAGLRGTRRALVAGPGPGPAAGASSEPRGRPVVPGGLPHAPGEGAARFPSVARRAEPHRGGDTGAHREMREENNGTLDGMQMREQAI